MKIDNIKQACFNTSLMGVIRGVLDYYGIKKSNGMAYGGSGHAFLINIHEVVCPSGPYCWKYDGFYRLLRNLGLQVTDLGFFHKDRKMEERKRMEDILRQHLDAKRACSTQNMDNQIIYGYDDRGFLLTQPWGSECDVTPATLTFGTWDEYGDEIHAIYLVYQMIQPADDETIIRDSLRYARDLAKNPKKYAFEKYTIGVEAYDVWIRAHEQGTAHAHGNWWNATVWSECRAMAAEYFTEIGEKYNGGVSAIGQELSVLYKDIAGLLYQVSDQEKPGAEKIPLLRQTKEKELGAVQKIEQFLQEFEKR
ncbi:hypothetical protein JXB22_09755 [candidate division WOR-3 bacterium]|nr:hypothetical protein [candidate division WOR-3 bacterium]